MSESPELRRYLEREERCDRHFMLAIKFVFVPFVLWAIYDHFAYLTRM